MSKGLAISLDELKTVASGSEVVIDKLPPKPSKGVSIRLADGTVRPRGKGRMPIGSVLLNDMGQPISLPVESKAKGKVPNYIKLLNGEVVVWARGRRPYGSVSCDRDGNPIS